MSPEDHFILSKGHAAGALYVTLWSLGVLSEEDLAHFSCGRHPARGPSRAGLEREIPVATGSLGHGFRWRSVWRSRAELNGEGGHVYCLTSDGEWQEGAMWEALIFWGHRRLRNLTVLVDVNGLQGFGTTRKSPRWTISAGASKDSVLRSLHRRPRSRAIAAAVRDHPAR